MLKNRTNIVSWAHVAAVGDRIVYAYREDYELSPSPSAAMEQAHHAHMMGLVFLAQRREGSGWNYEATRVSTRTATLLGLGPYGRGPEQ